MTTRALIGFLQSLPQDAQVHICGVNRFSIYFIKPTGETPYITFDTEVFDHEEFNVSKKGFKIFDSIEVSSQYEAELLRKEKIDESLKQSNAIINSLEKKGGK